MLATEWSLSCSVANGLLCVILFSQFKFHFCSDKAIIYSNNLCLYQSPSVTKWSSPFLPNANVIKYMTIWWSPGFVVNTPVLKMCFQYLDHCVRRRMLISHHCHLTLQRMRDFQLHFLALVDLPLSELWKSPTKVKFWDTFKYVLELVVKFILYFVICIVCWCVNVYKTPFDTCIYYFWTRLLSCQAAPTKT